MPRPRTRTIVVWLVGLLLVSAVGTVVILIAFPALLFSLMLPSPPEWVDHYQPIAPDTVMTLALPPDAAPVYPKTHTTLLAEYGNADKARATFVRLHEKQSTFVQGTLFGKTVLVSMPGSSTPYETLAALLAPGAKSVHAVWATSDQYDKVLQFHLQFTAPNKAVANAIADEITNYQLVAEFGGMTPWDAAYFGDRQHLPQWRKARNTLRTISEKCTGPHYDDPDVQAAENKMMDAMKKRDYQTAQASEQNVEKAQTAAIQKGYETLRLKPDADLDKELLAMHYALFKREGSGLEKGYDEYRQVMLKQVSPRCGQLPLTPDGQISRSAMRYSADYVSLVQSGGNTQTLAANFVNPHDGCIALMTWLKAQGCTDFRFQFDRAQLDIERSEYYQSD